MRRTSNHILIIDSSTSVLRIGLTLDSDNIAELSNSDKYRHAEFVFKLIDQLLNDNNIIKAQLSGIIVSSGPGSFTGLRVGMASAKGIAVSLGIPIVGVSTFSAIAEPVFSIHGPSLVVIPAKRDEFYYGIVNSEIFEIDSIAIVPTSELDSIAGDRPIFGVDIENVKYNEKSVSRISSFQPAIIDYLQDGKTKLDSGGDNLKELEPLYIQNFHVRQKK
ncbi:MAG: tRNA (adenosine(37)-N6)-threonylcarbamoyltransferase complex dimerization subunit type 1 TsaB [Candidatus Zixiibacteriota bacterium]